jgi:hypothetical protein
MSREALSAGRERPYEPNTTVGRLRSENEGRSHTDRCELESGVGR